MLHYRPTAPGSPPPMNLDGSLTCSAGQVAQLLGTSETRFRRLYALGQLTDFPRKLPGVGTWSRPSVIAWISNDGQPTAAGGTIPQGDPEIELIVSDLEAEYGTGRAA